MHLKQWAEREGVSYTTARRWFAAGKLPIPARRIGGLILVDEHAVGEDGTIPGLARDLLAACACAYGAEQARSRAHVAIDEAFHG